MGGQQSEVAIAVIVRIKFGISAGLKQKGVWTTFPTTRKHDLLVINMRFNKTVFLATLT